MTLTGGVAAAGSGSSLGSSVVSALGGLATTGLGMLANAYSSHKAFRRQKDLMRLQASLNYDYNKKQTLNQYDWQRQGLINADYNPMLAIQGASGPSSQSWAGAPTSPMSDFSGTGTQFANAANAINNMQMLDNQNKLLVSQNKNTNADTELKLTEANFKDMQTRNVELDNLRRQIENAYLPERQQRELDNIISSTIYNSIRGEVDRYNAATARLNAMNNSSYVGAQVDYLAKQGIISDAQADLLRHEIKWYGPNHVGSLIRDTGIGISQGVGAFTKPGLNLPADYTEHFSDSNGNSYMRSRSYY